MADVTQYTTGKRHVVKAGGCANIVILKPPAEYDVVDMSLSESVKFWLVNRLFLYVSGDNKASWKSFWNSLEGLVIDLNVLNDSNFNRDSKYKNGDRYLRPIKRDDYHVFFSQKYLTEADLKSKFKDLVIPDKTIIPENPAPFIPIPYPNIANGELNKKLETGYLKKGVKIIEIPLDKVQHQVAMQDLDYWIQVVLNQSKEQKIVEYRNNFSNISPKNVIKYITNKIGDEKAYKNYLNNRMNYSYFRSVEEEKNCFLKGWVTLSQSVNENQNSETSPRRFEDLKSEFYIHKMPQTQVMPIDNLLDFEIEFEKFKSIFKNKFDAAFTEEFRKKELATQEKRLNHVLLESLKETKKLHAPNMNIDKVKRYFSTYPTFKSRQQYSKDMSSMLALLGIANWHNTELLKALSISATYVGKNPCFSSLKKVYFASGSDAFSQDDVPRHVFIQLKLWWENLDENRKDFIKNCSYVEVIGYSSKKGKYSVNKRLRDDRAWKTAKALQILLKKEHKEPSILEVADSSSIGQLGGAADPLGSGSTTNNLQMIYYRSEAIDSYPVSTGSEVILSNSNSNRSSPQKRNKGDDRYSDRCATIIFHKVMPYTSEENKTTFMLKSLASAMAFPASRVSRIATVNKTGEQNYRCLMYLCPAKFEDGPGSNDDPNNYTI